jgi:hypothetical protein
MEVEDKKGFSKCRAQQTLKILYEYGANSLGAIEGIRGAHNGHW